MKILLTGATGYIAQRLLPVLLENNHEVVCCVRDKQRFNVNNYNAAHIHVIEVDFLKKETLHHIPADIDVAYYLIHSMATNVGDFEDMEGISAKNFKNTMQKTNVKQVIYLSGIVNDKKLSKHLLSRKNVENILSTGAYAMTTLRAGIIMGSGSASFEIIRDLVEKLPIIIGPRWLLTRSQPIAIRNVIQYLVGVILLPETFDKNFDIVGPDILSYKEMILRFGNVRGLHHRIFAIPFIQPRISAYWLYFVTSVSFSLAKNLVNSMKVEIIGNKNNLGELLGIKLISYDRAIELAFDKIEQNQVLSSWKDAQTSKIIYDGIANHFEVPSNGCFKDTRNIKSGNPAVSLEKIWQIGGTNGWYYCDWVWSFRGFIDKLSGGVGLRRGRKSPTKIYAGDALDFWRVLLANKEEKRLLLYAELKQPGESWLEFTIDQEGVISQTATFRPLGIFGRLYWYSVLPLHRMLLKGMIRKIASNETI